MRLKKEDGKSDGCTTFGGGLGRWLVMYKRLHHDFNLSTVNEVERI